MEETATIENDGAAESAELNQERAADNAKSEKGEKAKAPAKPAPNTAEMMLVLGIALIVDALGVLSDLSVVFSIPARIIVLPMLGGLLLWRMMKKEKKDYTFQIGITALAEISPLGGFLPSWTIFVLYVWFKDTKLGQSTVGKVQKLVKSKT